MRHLAVLLLVAWGLLSGQTGSWAQAQSGDPTTYTQETFYKWVKQYKDAKPAFKAGDVLTHADLEKVKPFMMPGYYEQYLKWKDLKMQHKSFGVQLYCYNPDQ